MSRATRPRRLIGADASAEAVVLSSDECQRLAERAIKLSKADACEIQLNANATGNTRFAANQMSTSGMVADVAFVVQSSYGSKHAVVVTNELSDDAIERAVRQSEALAKLAPDDPEAMPPLGPQTYLPVNAYFESTAQLTAGDRANVALQILKRTRAAGDLLASGFMLTSANSTALANNKGLFAYYRNTSANYQLTIRTSDGSGSGWAAADNQDWAKLDFASVHERALQKAMLSRAPVAIEPGRYTVILEAQAAGDLIQLIGNQADARSADEGRSPFTKPQAPPPKDATPAQRDSIMKAAQAAGPQTKIGEKIMDERVTIFADPQDPQLLSQPFDGDGLPVGRQVFVDKGVLKELYYSRYWAKKMGKQPTGQPQGIKMMGGDASVDDLIKSTERGVLVTRLWYLRQVDPRTILYTGLTRDGTFLIENGKISKAIRNFRFNDSPLFMLNNLEMLGRAERVAGTEQGGDVVMPSIKVKDFNFTSLSEAV
ncbi:MAG TPA: TldD/PmbA family protein [Gemmatimonadaceae bacterium]|nr:TldD/PmbA family protein [Gemmatimonadaceae bacterium]